MIVLAIGVIAFAVFHLLPAIPAAKSALKARTGEEIYGPVFGGISVIALALIVLGWRSSGFAPVYDPADWGRYVNFVLMALAFMCLGIFIFRGRLRQTLRYPLAIGVLLWSSGHLLANGDLASLILFGGFSVYAVTYLIAGVVNSVRPSPEVRSGHDILSIVIGLALYGAMTQLHPLVTGVPILVLTK